MIYVHFEISSIIEKCFTTRNELKAIKIDTKSKQNMILI